MTKKGEHTSARVARIAGKVLGSEPWMPTDGLIWLQLADLTLGKLSWAEIKALAASALTQAPNRTRAKTAQVEKPKRFKKNWKVKHYRPVQWRPLKHGRKSK